MSVNVALDRVLKWSGECEGTCEMYRILAEGRAHC